MIGDFTFLKDWMIRSEKNDALNKLFVRNLKSNEEEELKITEVRYCRENLLKSLFQKLE